MVFYSFGELSLNLELLLAKSFRLGESKMCGFGKGLKFYLPDDKILDLAILKPGADNYINCAQMIGFVFVTIYVTVGKMRV